MKITQCHESLNWIVTYKVKGKTVRVVFGSYDEAEAFVLGLV